MAKIYNKLYTPRVIENTNIDYNSLNKDIVLHIFKWHHVELANKFDYFLKADHMQALCNILN